VFQLPPIRPGPLAPSQIELFFEQGFLIVPKSLSSVEMIMLREAFGRLQETAYGLETTQDHDGSYFVLEQDPKKYQPTRIHRVVWCGGSEPELSALGAHPTLAGIASQILGTRLIQQLINQAHFKIPGDQVSFSWHQDSLHRRYGTRLWTDVNGLGSFVEIITAVDPMSAENGCIKLIPKSHLKGHIPVEGANRRLPASSFDPAAAIDIHLSPGQMLLVHPYTVHGSEANQSGKPRRLFLNGFAYPGANRRTYPGRDAGRFLDVSPHRTNRSIRSFYADTTPLSLVVDKNSAS